MKPVKYVVFCAVTLILLMSFKEAVFSANDIKLPKPAFTGKMSVESAMLKKKSVRHFSKDPLTLEQVSQLLWAANGALPVDAISGATVKTLPSAGGIYPLEIFLLTGSDTVKGLPAGIFQYYAISNSLVQISQGDGRLALAQAALSQLWIASAPAVVVIAASFNKMTAKYGNQGIKYVFMESGSSNQNLFLQAEALGLRIGTVGAFEEGSVSSAIKIPAGVTPLFIVPVGK
ncbi:MAG: SagB/ThcOx family dehydrogenase [Deltaproteobacteria bacterium]|nr:SagB/ThcOx family dehydrogenase [Deltaproteobacteria bacterium]